MAKETKEVIGWKWETKGEFLAAKSSADEALGLPMNDECTTKSSISEKTNDHGGGLFWYCGINSQLTPIFGDPVTFIINFEGPDLTE